MKALIICISIHRGNTEKIAKAMGEVLEAELLKPHVIDASTLAGYDLVGFGSGIYSGKHHASLLNLVDKLTELKGKRAFVFATGGTGKRLNIFHGTTNFHNALKKKLLEKRFDIIGEFDCRGWDTYSWFKYVWGISKGRPNEKDLEKARNFAKDLEKIFGK